MPAVALSPSARAPSPPKARSATLADGRFELRHRLGEGGMGVVFAAHDRVRGELVALKTLPRPSAEGVLALKREFRAVADLTHPNLPRFHELFEDAGRWFFTMELVHGVDALAYLRGARSGDRPTDPSLDDTVPFDTRALAVVAAESARELRRVLGQLASALAMVHQAGKTHRDVKPSNVLVRDDGHVVLLDFGLVLGAVADRGTVAGTPAYMAPEQITGDAVGPAADVYALGLFAFEALTGSLPFAGPVPVMLAKRVLEPSPRPSELAPVPPELDALVTAMLATRPQDRPSAGEVAARLGASVRVSLPPPSGLVARDDELAALEAVRRLTLVDGPRVAFVHGPSGIGKSALLARFLEGATLDGACVLSGRCHPSETVPFKAIDALVDALVAELGGGPRRGARGRDEVACVTGVSGGASLTRLFPALAPVLDAGDEVVPHDRAEVVRLGCRALAEVLRRCVSADGSSIVMALDDAQWGDRADAAMLVDLLACASDLPLLLVVAHRDASSEGDDLATLLRARLAGARTIDVPLAPLSEAGVAQLACALGAPISPSKARALSRDAGGNALFVVELLRSSGASPEREGATLDERLAERASRAEPLARRVLALASLATRPLPLALVAQALDETRGAVDDATRELAVARLVVVDERDDGRVVAPSHDRVREAVADRVHPREARELHRALAETLTRAGEGTDEELFEHHRAAGDALLAAAAAERAAARAAERFLLGRAAALYRAAIDLRGRTDRAAWIGLADALARDGRGAEAARAYHEAASREGDAAETAWLHERAASELLRSGYVERGREAMDAVLRSLGLGVPSGALGLVVLLLWTRLRLLVGVCARPATERALLRVDSCWSAATGLAGDPVRFATHQARHLLLATQAREPRRLARAQVAEVLLSAMSRGGDAPATRRAIERARAAAGAADDASVSILAQGIEGVAAYLAGRFPEARDVLVRADASLAGAPVASAWERDTFRFFTLESLAYEGRLRELRERITQLIPEAEQRGDRYAATMMRTGIQSLAWLADDDPREVRHQVELAARVWTPRGFHVQHFLHLYALVSADLYEGRGADALARVTRPAASGTGPSTREAMLLCRGVPFLRVAMAYLRGRAALSAAQGAPPRERAAALAMARREARLLERREEPLARAYGAALRGAAALASGDRASAAVGLREAEAGFSSLGMRLFAAAASRALAFAEEDVHGARAAAALAAFSRELVRRPERLAETLLPVGA